MELRYYQREAVERTYDYLRTSKGNPCIVTPTASGKSVIIAQIVTDAVKRWGGRVLILAHVKELLEQNASKVIALCPDIDIGVYSAGLSRRDTRNSVIVAGIQSVANRACELGKFDLIVIDEAHCIPSSGEGQYRTFLRDAMTVNPKLRVIGLTATPYRLDGGLICKPENILNDVSYEVGIKDMIARGYLSPVISKAGLAEADLSCVHTRHGEFINSELDCAMNREDLVRSSCEEIVAYTRDRNAVIIFGCSVSHCANIKAAIEDISGMECGIVTGDTPSDERAETIARIRHDSGHRELKYLVNMGCLTTGFDAPNIDCVAIMRATQSAGLFVQMVGRGMRLSPSTGKKDCLVLDFGDNVMRHGPIDSIRVKDRAAREKVSAIEEDEEQKAIVCPQCRSISYARMSVCPDCGYVFVKPREPNHNAVSSSEGILSGQSEDTTLDVEDIIYSVWRKKNANTSTMLVEYVIGLTDIRREWVCPEHSGYARTKFVAWWTQRSMNPSLPVPDTAADAVSRAEGGELRKARSITMRHVTGEKFDRIVSCVLEDDDSMAEGCGCNVGEQTDAPLPDIEDGIPF